MPTFNQLVRKGREAVVTKSTAPALQVGYNSQKKKATDQSAPQPGQLYPAVGAACLSGSGPCAAAGNHPGHDKGVTFQSVRGACLRQRDKGVCCTT